MVRQTWFNLVLCREEVLVMEPYQCNIHIEARKEEMYGTKYIAVNLAEGP